MPSIDINVQDIFTQLLSINSDTKTIKSVVGLYSKCFSVWRADHSWKCLAIIGKRTERRKIPKAKGKNEIYEDETDVPTLEWYKRTYKTNYKQLQS